MYLKLNGLLVTVHDVLLIFEAMNIQVYCENSSDTTAVQSGQPRGMWPTYMVSRRLCKSASEGLYRGSNGSCIAMADMASSPNLNLSGKVKGHTFGMHILYPQSTNNRAVLTLRIIPNFLI